MPTLPESIQTQITQTRARHPFLSFLIMQNGDLHAGIIQNSTAKTILFYDFDKIPDEPQRREFLLLADQWWWGSGQSIPVNYFIGRRFDLYQPCLIGYPKKAIAEVIGPIFSLADSYVRRIKMKRIEILKRIPMAA